MIPIVPKDLDSTWLKKILVRLNSPSNPEFIDCVPCEHALANECYPNVEEKIKKDGGSTIYGWQIWQTENLIEAEFHAIWKSEDGQVIDITPNPFNVERILFVRDLNTKYLGRQIDNISLTDKEFDDWQFLEQMREYISILIAKGSTKNQECFCGRGKYKKCHGRALIQCLERL